MTLPQSRILRDAARILAGNLAPCPVRRRGGDFVYITPEHIRAIKEAARNARMAEESQEEELPV